MNILGELGSLVGGILGLLILVIISIISFYAFKAVKSKVKALNVDVFNQYIKIVEDIVTNKVKLLTEEQIRILLEDEDKIPFAIADFMDDVFDTVSDDIIKIIDSLTSFEKVVVDKLYDRLREMKD